MVNTLRVVAAVTVAAASAVYASDLIACNSTNACPSSAPCCSSYGFCGVGAYCLGGCYPPDSHDLDSCMPAPTCQSADYALDNLDSFVRNTQYLGDPSDGNWVYSGNPLVYDSSILLTMTEESSGTLLSSTRYVWYGNISATLKTSQGAGVVTAFIMMSDVKDEIDFEFIGTDVQNAQSNYYFQGITDYENEKNVSAANTESTWHTYTIDWNPGYLNWMVDGVVLRTLFRNETYNSTTGQYHYPQTPSRVQFSLWPAGKAGNQQGTIEWSGGAIDWNSPYMSNGYYYAMVKDVSVDCYDPPSGYLNHGTKSYWYNSIAGTNDTVVIGNNGTVLSSFQATGDKPSIGASSASASATSSSKSSATSSSSSSSSSSNDNTVPGDSGGGVRGGSTTDGDSGDGSSSSSSASSASSSDASSGGSSSGGSSFSQGTDTDTNDGNRVVAGSLVALVAFFAAAMML